MTELDDRLRGVVQSGLQGVVAATADWAGAAGLANVETGEPLTPDHRLRSGA